MNAKISVFVICAEALIHLSSELGKYNPYCDDKPLPVKLISNDSVLRWHYIVQVLWTYIPYRHGVTPLY